MQQRNGRRGEVFSIRLRAEQRLALERLRIKVGGPFALGPWLVWNALERGNTKGIAGVGSTRLLGSSGSTSNLPRQGTTARSARDGNTKRLILDLCGGSGAWSEPYRKVGFRVINVTLPKFDVRMYVPPKNVFAVLAAPPCTEFSLAKNGQVRDYLSAFETVAACMRIIALCRPVWWALENPVGLLQRWLGEPQFTFEPYHFGDPWTKRTAIWGNFTVPVTGPYVKPLGSGPLCRICDPKQKRIGACRKAGHRAITPPGFVRAFFKANS